MQGRHSHEHCSDSVSTADFQLPLYHKLIWYSVILKMYAKNYFTRYSNSEVICFERFLTVFVKFLARWLVYFHVSGFASL
jgi:proteasome lid subunit RPN8/RPN11